MQRVDELDTLFMRIADHSENAEQRHLVVNGQPFEFDIHVVSEKPNVINKNLNAWCNSRESSAFNSERDYLIDETEASPAFSWSKTSPDAQTFGCFKTESTGFRDLVRRLIQVTDSHDLDALGQFYFYKMDAFEDRVRIVSLSTSSGFDMERIFTHEGDVAGIDVPGVPRPKGSRRLFSVGEAGESGIINVYGESEFTINEHVETYRSLLNRSDPIFSSINQAGMMNTPFY